MHTDTVNDRIRQPQNVYDWEYYNTTVMLTTWGSVRRIGLRIWNPARLLPLQRPATRVLRPPAIPTNWTQVQGFSWFLSGLIIHWNGSKNWRKHCTYDCSFVIKDANHKQLNDKIHRRRSGRVSNSKLPCPFPLDQEATPARYMDVVTNQEVLMSKIFIELSLLSHEWLKHWVIGQLNSISSPIPPWRAGWLISWLLLLLTSPHPE